MSEKCNIKDKLEALNTGINAFRKAVKINGGKLDSKSLTQALRYAVKETQIEHKDFDFETTTLTNHIVEKLKKDNVIDAKYEFGEKSKAVKKNQDEKIKELAEDIVSKNEKEPNPKKKSNDEFSQEDAELRRHIASKYGKTLDKEDFDALMSHKVGDSGATVKSILQERVQEIKDINESKKREEDLKKKFAKEVSEKQQKQIKEKERQEKFKNKIKKLREDISSGKLADKKDKNSKREVFTEEEKEIIKHVKDTQGITLTPDEFDALMSQDVDGISMKHFIQNEILDKNIDKNKANESKKREEDLKKHEKKIIETLAKIKGLNESQKEQMARKLYEEFAEKGTLSAKDVKNIYSAIKGLPHNSESLNSLIDKQSENLKNLDDLQRERDEIEKEMNDLASKNSDGKLDKSQDIKYEKKLNDLEKKMSTAEFNAVKSTISLSSEMAKYDFGLFKANNRLRLNLMSFPSLGRNLTGTIPDALLRYYGSLVSGPIDAAIYAGAKLLGKDAKRTVKTGSKIIGTTKSIPTAFSNFGKQWAYGESTYNNKLSHVNQLSTAKNVQDIKRFIGNNNSKAAWSAVGLLLNAHPDFIQRTLGSTDTFIHTMIYSAEINSIADARGLTGAKKKLFLMKPDESSHELAKTKADKATFRNNPTFLGKEIDLGKLNFDPKKWSQIMIDGKIPIPPFYAKTMAGLVQTLTILTVPFIKVPINILSRATELTIPEIGLTRAITAGISEKDPVLKQKIIAEGLGQYVAGNHFRIIAYKAIALGLASLGYKDEDKKIKDAVQGVMGGAGQINSSALLRGLMFGDMTPRKNDRIVNLTSLGVTGVALGAYTQAFHKMSKQEKEDALNFSENPSNILSLQAYVAFAQLQSVMDNTFLSGTNQLFQALSGNGSVQERYGINMMSTVLTSLLPSTHQKISTSWEENVKQPFDPKKGFWENLQNKLGYQYFFESKELKNKYFSLAALDKNGNQVVTVKRDHVLFDNALGRAMFAVGDVMKNKEGYDPDATLSKLYDYSLEAPLEKNDEDVQRAQFYPNGVNEKQTLILNGSKETVMLNKEQWEFLQVQTSNRRMLEIEDLVHSEEFKNLDAKHKAKSLQDHYLAGLYQARKDVVNKYGLSDFDVIQKEDKDDEYELVKDMFPSEKTKTFEEFNN